MTEALNMNIGIPKVAIVTRTKNRNVLLARAAESVGAQTFQDYIWVVVNDGGDEASVRQIVDNGSVPRERSILVSHATSVGMEGASNAGIAASRSEYIVILDDDDTWAPEFLEKCVDFLEGSRGARFGGVVTYSTYVSEAIRGDEVIRFGERPYQNRLEGVDLTALLEHNLFPTNSFLFRRSVHDKIGGFDATLPVLGDWLFNLEFVLRSDIGIIPEALSYYHHRDRPELTAEDHRNSVIDKLSLHQNYTAIVRNDFVRRNLGHSAVSLVLAMRSLAPPTAAAPDPGRATGNATASSVFISGGDSDLPWVINAINSVLADRRLASLWRNRKLSALPPNATWSLALPQLGKLGITVPPPPDFDEAAYLAANPDVATEVRTGGQKSGFMHYVNHGREEGRARPGGGYRIATLTQGALPGNGEARNTRAVFDSPFMVRNAHRVPGFDKVLNVAHHEWHGIRQATAYSPGRKLLISADEPLNARDCESVAEECTRTGIERICFHGYSQQSDRLLLYLRSVLGPDVKFYVVSHCSSALFAHRGEMEVIAKLLGRLKLGMINRLGSVKPDFGNSIEGYWPHTVVNFAPNVPLPKDRRASQREAYVPLNAGWHKNLYSNVLAASAAERIDLVKTTNPPEGLADIHPLSKLRLVGFLRGQDLLNEMARSSITLNVTLAECQPMTQLESLAVGTPTLTGPLHMEEFASDPLIDLCTTYHLDNPAMIARDIDRIMEVLERDPAEMEQMIVAHLAARHAVAARNLAEFLQV